MADRISNGSVKRSLAETLAFRTREGQGKAIAKGQLSDFAGIPATGQDLPSGKNVSAGADPVASLREGFRNGGLKNATAMKALLDLQDETAGGSDALARLMEKVDKDKDGKISGDEMQAFLNKRASDSHKTKREREAGDGEETNDPVAANQDGGTGSDVGDFALGQAGKTMHEFEKSLTDIGQTAGRALALFAATSANAYAASHQPGTAALATV